MHKQISHASGRKFYIWMMILSIVSSAWAYSYYYFWDSGYPLLSFMTSEIGRFDDFYNSLYSSQGEILSNKAGGTVWPGSVFLYNLLSIQNTNLACIIYLIGSSFVFFLGIGKLSNSYLIPILAFTSYPFWFSIARGNNEHLLAGLAALAYYWLRKNVNRKYFAYALVQQSIEPYPLYLLQILQFNKVILLRLLKIFFLIMAILIALLLFGYFDTYVISLLSEGSGGVSSAWPGSSLHSSSLSSLIQFIYFLKTGAFPYEEEIFNVILKLMVPISTAFCGIIMYKYRGRMNVQSSTTFLISTWTLFHSTSFDYRLVHFFIPISLIYFFGTQSLDKVVLILIFFLMVPKPYLWFVGSNNVIGETLGSVVNPLILICIILVTMYKVHFFPVKKEKTNLPSAG
jgi:hypothetical protein